MLESLDSPPRGSDPFLWTDFVEIRALVHPDKCLSRGDLASIEKRSTDLGRGFPADMRWREVVNFSLTRASDFGSAYPFKVSNALDLVSFDCDDSAAQHTYLRLLLASCMRHIPKTHQGEIARAFEEACFAIFSKLMPNGAEVRATWAHGGAEAPYTGNLYEKMRQIAGDLRCTPNFEADDFKDRDTGDGGIDLIAWHPMADSRDGMPIAFAQCGCSRDDWRSKQVEAAPTKHRRHLPVMHPWATYYFMPQDLRRADGDFAYKSDIGEAIIVDRLRLVRLATQYGLHEALPEMPLLEEAQLHSYS